MSGLDVTIWLNGFPLPGQVAIKSQRHGRANVNWCEPFLNVALARSYAWPQPARSLSGRHRFQMFDDVPNAIPCNVLAGTNRVGLERLACFRPMLATHYQGFAPGFAQPKLDGIRCIARASGLFTRTGIPIPGAPHISMALRSFFACQRDAILDGEIYVHTLRQNFERISGLARRTPTNPTNAQSLILQYHIYDLPSFEGNFQARHQELQANLELGPTIFLVETLKVDHQNAYDTLHARWLEQGYEGSMWRADALYRSGRSSALRKRKPSLDMEFRCLAIEPGTGAFADKAKRVLCSLPDGRTFRANIEATHARARELLAERHAVVTLKFQNFTSSGIPRFPVAIRFWGDARQL